MYQAPPPALSHWSKGRAIAAGLIIYAIGAVLFRVVLSLFLANTLLVALSCFVIFSLVNLAILRVVRAYKRSQKH
ncbi:hypothetical protein Hgul01_02938 [Herpetosiphon gulosus]|uniref:Uncharacterized protein n=1 Tax=Herpetosiphon gulosus TaxID=1973496 RepID=A0ABP9X3I5_9CHLR